MEKLLSQINNQFLLGIVTAIIAFIIKELYSKHNYIEENEEKVRKEYTVSVLAPLHNDLILNGDIDINKVINIAHSVPHLIPEVLRYAIKHKDLDGIRSIIAVDYKNYDLFKRKSKVSTFYKVMYDLYDFFMIFIVFSLIILVFSLVTGTIFMKSISGYFIVIILSIVLIVIISFVSALLYNRKMSVNGLKKKLAKLKKEYNSNYYLGYYNKTTLKIPNKASIRQSSK